MANPERMPAILKQATEALLGVGEIDSIINDLVAFERRTLLQMKKTQPRPTMTHNNSKTNSMI